MKEKKDVNQKMAVSLPVMGCYQVVTLTQKHELGLTFLWVVQLLNCKLTDPL